MDETLKQIAELTAEVKRLNEEGRQAEIDYDKLAAAVVAQQKATPVRSLIASEAVTSDSPEHLHKVKSNDPEVVAFQKAADRCYLMGSVLHRDPRTLKSWGAVAKMLNTTDDSSWVPTDLSSQVLTEHTLSGKIPGVFPSINMLTDPYKVPWAGSPGLAQAAAEPTTDNPSAFTAGDIASNAVTLTAKTINYRIPISVELTEDALAQVLDRLLVTLSDGITDTVESMILNGDTTASHRDSVVTAATDPRKLWMGLRWGAQDRSCTFDFTDTGVDFTEANLLALLAKMGKYGVPAARVPIFVSPKAHVKMLGATNFPSVVTLDKVGAGAPVMTGAIAFFFGHPVFASQWLADTSDASGADTGASTFGQVVAAAADQWLLGVRTGVTVGTDTYNASGHVELGVRWRGAFAPVMSTSYPIAAHGYNITV